MPRKLPWMIQAESTLATASKRRVVSPTKLSQKRARVSELATNNDIEKLPSPIRARTPGPRDRDEHIPQSSPPPEYLPERFMHEGMEHDDKYRMVEDEFLATAHRFTVYLHAAEYKRQEKIARARNAETINSISCPVTEKMSDHTKRKVDDIAKSKMPQDTVQSVLGSKTEAQEELEDSSDGEGLAYFNTTLRGLMDSPRRKGASLSRLPYTTATRATAGFQKPASLQKQDLGQSSGFSKSESFLQGGQPLKSSHNSTTDSSDLDDDLDAPVPVSKFPLTQVRPDPTSRLNSVQARIVHPKPSNEQILTDRKPPSSENSLTPKAVETPSNDDVSRVRRRQFRARLEETKKEEEEDRKNLNLIPTFL